MQRSTLKRYRGVSKKTIVHRTRIGGRDSTIITAGRQDERESAARERRRAAIRDLRDADRQVVAQMDIEMHGAADDVDAIDNTVALGEEGTIDMSHEGGEFEVIESLAKEIALSTGYRRVDDRTRSDRTELKTQHWLTQLDQLVNAYLAFQSTSGFDGLAVPEQSTQPTDVPSERVLTIHVVDIFFHKTLLLPVAVGEIHQNETLLRNGCLGCSPLMPTVAITVRSLSAYRQIHRTCPRFSIEAFSKALCHLHNVPFQAYLQKQLTDAFDIYLEICRRVDKRLDEELGFITPATRLARHCPLCFYKLQDEPSLEFSALISMDGNSSLKRIGATVRQRDDLFDSRTIDSDQWLSAEEVDQFKNEVAQRPEIGAVNDPVNFNHQDGDANPMPTAHDNNFPKCADRWKNAGPEQRKRMFGLFEETGIFIAACRHRTVLYACDMIKSGELAKYPLAIVNRVINEVGENVGCAYDIGCTFQKTVENSTLGSRAEASGLRFMVGSFHGYAHERACQLKWHPLYMQGTGRTEGEGCEHVFSSSNDLARGTRHASRFHRHQAIDEHFKFWNQDKYALLSTFIINHYKEATQVIKKLEGELAADKETLGCSDDDFKNYLDAEKEYLSNLENPDPVIEKKKDYVKSLRQLYRYRLEWERVCSATAHVCRQLAVTGDDSRISEAKYNAEVSYGQVQNAEALVTLYEMMLGISQRWTEDSAEYKQYYKENIETSFRKSVDELERLVAMRISEVAKLRESGLGVKLREHIVKAVNRRSESVRKAISRYNEQATLLDPPAPTISWQEISEYTFIGEFDILRIARSDVRQEKWVQKAYHDAGTKYFKLCRAWEEVKRLNIEVHRLLAWIRDEKDHAEQVIERLSTNEPHFADELRKRWALRSSVNMIHFRRLKTLQNEDYYTGSRGCSGEAAGMLLQSVEGITLQDDQVAAEIEQEEDFQSITDYIANIDD